MNTSEFASGFLCGMRESIAVSLAGGLFGAVFGLLAISHGFSAMQTSLMSAFVYAGTAQVMALSVLSQPDFSMMSLLFMTLVICSRYFLMGVTIRPLIQSAYKKFMPVSLFTLMDENWALTTVKARVASSSKFIYGYFCGSGALAYVVWIGGTITGVICADYIHHPQQLGLDFVFTSLFLALLVSSWRGKQEWLPWISCFILTISLKQVLPANWNIICAALIASAIGALNESRL